MIVAVTGGRDFQPTHADSWALRSLLVFLAPTLLRHGACKGADLWFAAVAQRLSIPTEAFPADWSQGKSAGPRRNRLMLAGADHLISAPGGVGTNGCIRIAHELRISVSKICPK